MKVSVPADLDDSSFAPLFCTTPSAASHAPYPRSPVATRRPRCPLFPEWPQWSACCLLDLGWSELSTDPEAGTRQWTLVHDSKTVVLVFDALCALSFVGWLWPAAMEEELGTQPTCPDYVGPGRPDARDGQTSASVALAASAPRSRW